MSKGIEAIDPVLEKVEVTRLKRTAQRAIGLMALGLPILFTYLSFKNVPLGEVIKSLSSASATIVLWKIILAIYFLLWVWGTKTDADDQELVYRFVPNRGELPSSSIGILVAIFVLAAILLWSPNFEVFVAALTTFFALNLFSWQYLVRKIALPSLQISSQRSEEAGDLIGVEQLRVVKRYLCGGWQWYRFIAGALVIFSLWAILYARHSGLNTWISPEPISWDLLQALGMLAFVVVMEAWIWGERLRTKISLKFLADFRSRFLITEKLVNQ